MRILSLWLEWLRIVVPCMLCGRKRTISGYYWLSGKSCFWLHLLTCKMIAGHYERARSAKRVLLRIRENLALLRDLYLWNGKPD